MAEYKIEDALQYDNIAELLDEEELDKLAEDLIVTIDADDDSRSEWINSQEDWLKLASQVRESKSFPWQNASNVKYPLMTTACIQFHARSLPGLINTAEPVLVKVHGSDPTGEKLSRATRVRKYMSYQVMEEMEEWLDEMDRMLFVLPMIGICYKKTYYSEIHKRNRSVLILPRDLIVNYNAQSYDRARLTHVLYMDDNEIVELQRENLFLDVPLQRPDYKEPNPVRDDIIGLNHSSVGEEDSDLRKVYESHCWLDLDDDGYKEPYIVTIDTDSRKILRIVARWVEGDVQYNGKQQVKKITPHEYFTPYIFLPDPNSAVYGLGFGTLLGPTNEAVNTLINQLIDAGTLSNMQSGFLARGMKIKGGVTRFKPGEWKIANTSGTDLKNSIVPLPVKEPSGALFNLLGLLISSGEKISSVSDIMLGENPGQNQPAHTTMTVLEQGLKVFTGIHRRLHRSLAKEYKKLYKLNGIYLDNEHYAKVLDEQVDAELQEIAGEATPEEMEIVADQLRQQNANSGREDFENDSLDVSPASDPNMVSEAQKMVKSQSLMEKLVAGLPLNVQEITRRMLEAEQHEDIDILMQVPEQGPTPDEIKVQIELERAKREVVDSFFTAIEKVAKAESLEEGTQLNVYSSFVKDFMALQQLEQGGKENANSAGTGPTPGASPG